VYRRFVTGLVMGLLALILAAPALAQSQKPNILVI